MNDMRSPVNDMWERLHRLWAAGTPCGLATVVSAYGSAPRQPGALMICASDGTVTGSVSGGCVEGAVYDLAQQAIRDGVPVLERYAVSDNDAGAIGLTCGGAIEVLVERVDRQSFPELGLVMERLRAGDAVAVATVVEPHGSVPAGTHLVYCSNGTTGSTGDAILDAEVAETARHLLTQRRSHTLRAGTAPRVFVNCLAPPPRMMVYGATEFASALTRQGALLGYRVTVCDARPVFITPERFPDADEVVVDWPHRHLAAEAAAGRLGPGTVVVSLTHDPKFDVPLLQAALQMDLAYVGALGSRRTAGQRKASLRAAGVRDDQLARLCSPAGLDLGGAEPAEAALSIAAEILLHRHVSTGARLSETEGAIHRLAPAPVVSQVAAG